MAERCRDYIEARELPAQIVSAQELASREPRHYRMALTFGGDGTALRAADWLLGSGVPIVPIRMGKLSFLGEIAHGRAAGGAGAAAGGPLARRRARHPGGAA